MNDLTKTLTFAGVALVIALAAIFFRPAPFEPVRQKAGERLFAELEDPTAADALQIVSFDPDSSTSQRLKIERDGDQWVIASHNNYPADASGAKDRIQEVALKLIDLEILDVASNQSDDHGLYGVVEPPQEGQVQEADDNDIGLLVELQGDDGNTLAKLIIGKQVRDEQREEVKRFVRKYGEETVYTAAIDTDQLKTKFSDWIDSDPLDIFGSDIRRVAIKDYNVVLRDVARLPDGRVLQEPQYDPRFEMAVDWDNETSQWEFAELVERRGNRLVPSELTESEELNGVKLDELKRAVDNLKIVDVEAKPKQLIEGVSSDKDLAKDPAVEKMLTQKGFYPGGGELLASAGEVRVQTDDGVEFILRFGGEASLEQDEENKSKLTRYMLVSAAIAEEQLKPKPKEEDAPPTGDPSGPGPVIPPLGAGGQDGDEGEPGTASGDAVTTEGEAPDRADSPAEENAAQPATTDNGNSVEAEDEPASPPVPPDTIPPEADSAREEEDELTKKRKEAEEKVADLNKKFAPWFYVISEDEYKKIRLRRFDLIKEKDGSSFGLDELKDLDELPRDDQGEDGLNDQGSGIESP